MKLSVVTPHAVYHYGTVLQAHALYRFLQQSNHEVYIQDLPCIKKQAASLREKAYITLSRFGRMIHSRSIAAGDRAFEAFISEFEQTEQNDLPMYIVGSDQVWHPGNLDEYFSLRFTHKNSKRLSYAASMGVNRFPKCLEADLKETVTLLSGVSVREEQTAREVQRIAGVKCPVHVDPVFLLDKEYWIKQEIPVPVRHPYVLLYLLHIPGNIHRVIRDIKRQYKCDILLIDRAGFMRYMLPGVLGMGSAGPREFLWLVDHAESVVTSSFHGTAFSIIFEKQFRALINPSFSSRIDHLLKIAGISGSDTVNYSQVKKNLEPHIQKSKQYLTENI